MTAVLHMRLFGGLDVTLGDAPLTGFVSNKVSGLLVYLAVTQRPHRRDTLATLLWSEMPDADAKSNLRQALSNLRKFVEPYLIITRETVAFNAEAPHILDCAAFLAVIKAISHPSSSEQAERVQGATSLYLGDFLAGFQVRDAPDFEEWVLVQRARFRELALQTLHTLTNFYLVAGEYAAAIEAAGRLLTLDAWREEAHQQLMLALARSGQRSAALQQYETCRGLLLSELGVEPSAEITALARRVRYALQKGRPNLPAPTGPFVGRERELAMLRQRQTDPSCRLLTLTGPGGIGKTRLALEVATANQARFLNGVCFVGLAGVNPDNSDAALVAVIDALQLTLAGPTSAQEQLYNALHPTELLLVLDNLEHLIAQIGWLDALLEQAPDIKILATSRERLNLAGEWVVELDGMPVPAADNLHEMQTGAAQLFVTNARRVSAGFELTADNAPAICRICQLVGGLPLGIVLASAWVHILSCADIAQEIAANLDFLGSTRRDMPPRQRGLRAVFDHSWRLLSPNEKTAFASLAIFRGSFEREAAHNVTGVTTMVLASLVDKSLIRRQQNGRHELHDVLRQYADQKVVDETRSSLQARHAAYFARWLKQQESRLHSPQEVEIYQGVMADHDNLRAYWQWAVSQQELPLLAQGLTTLREFYTDHGRFQEGMDWLQQTAAMLSSIVGREPDNHPARQLLGKVLGRWASFCLWGGQEPQAEPLFGQALPIARDFGEPAELGLVLLNWGYLTVLGGNYTAAEQQFTESLDQYRRAEEAYGIASALSALGALSNITGANERAREYLEESTIISRQIQDARGLRTSLTNLGNVFYLDGEYGRARDYYLQVLPLCEKAGDRYAEAVIISNLGSLAFEGRDYAEAETLFQKGLRIFKELNILHYIIHGTTSLAGVHVAQANYEQASRELHWALQSVIAEQIHQMAPMAIYEIGLLYQAMGRAEEALELLYYVLDHPASLAEQKQGVEQRLPDLEAHLGLAKVAQVREQAKQVTPEAVLANLAEDHCDRQRFLPH